MSQKPEGWQEPFLRGLWSYDLLFGAPRFLLWFTIPLFAAAVLLPSQDALVTVGVVQALGFGITQLEPEWATILHDLIKNSGEIEP